MNGRPRKAYENRPTINPQVDSSIVETYRQLRHAKIVDRLRRSELFRSYREIFQSSSHLPLEMIPVDGEERGEAFLANGNPFCRLLNEGGEGCAKCLQAHRCLASDTNCKVKSMTCFAGMERTVVPVMAGKVVVAHLKTGQVLTNRPKRSDASRICGLLEDMKIDRAELEEAYMDVPVVSRKKYFAMVTLLSAFSLQLTKLASQISLELEGEEDTLVERVKDYVEENILNPIRLENVASEVGVSLCHVCRKFKAMTGMTFTDYVTGRRVELVKESLLETKQPITAIAFEAGFRSLSQFNRCFRRVEGISPSQYRERVAA